MLGFEKARSASDQTRAAEGKPFRVRPADIPNTGVLFVDRQKRNRSGHGHNSLAECRNGDIVAFYSVTGTWQDPQVKQLQGSEVGVTPLKNCEEYLAKAVTESLKE